MRNLLLKAFRGNPGFTLVEMLIALAVGGIVIAGLAASVVQLIKVSQSDSSQITLNRELDVAGNWFIRDFQSAQSLPSGLTLSRGSNTLILVQSLQQPSDSSVSYDLGSDGTLRRTVGSASVVIARNITSVVYSVGDPVTLTITANVGQKQVVRTYNVVSRLTPG